MTRTIVTRDIAASPETVFDAVAHIDNFSQVVPEIVKVEYLTEQKRGVGTRFLETRNMKGQEATVELEVTEYEPNGKVRIVSDTHGTVWDTVFRIEPHGEYSRLTMTMDANAYKLLPKLMNPLIKGMIQNAIESDMDRVKEFCEQRTSEASR